MCNIFLIVTLTECELDCEWDLLVFFIFCKKNLIIFFLYGTWGDITSPLFRYNCAMTTKTLYSIINPSIHFLYLLNPLVGSWGGWSLSQQSSSERRGTPWTGRQSITGPHRDKQPHTRSHSLLRIIFETPINLTCMF